MSGVLSIFAGQTTSQPTQCADVVITPDTGSTPLTIGLATTTAGAHIFYTNSLGGTNPVHTGDSAGAGTNRIGSNSGSLSIGAGTHVIRAVAYEPTHLDSNISEGNYEPGGGP